MGRAISRVLKRWSQVREFFPEDLSERALRTGAVERFRKFRNGEDLLLGSLLCALPGDTFESASRALKLSCGVQVSGPGMFLKFAKTEGFLQEVFTHVLGHAQREGAYFAGRRVVIVDATALCGPGATGKDQVVHVVYNVSSGLPERVDLTNNRGGETFLRHKFESGDLVLADRGYAHPKAMLHLLGLGASLLVRFEFESIRLWDPDGTRITPELARARVGDKSRCEFPALIQGWEKPLRVMGCLNPKGKIVWLLTDLSEDELPLKEARSLYAVRWQIELFFKRLKSLLDLDELPTRDGPSARPWIWAKLILAALVVLSSDERFSPWGSPA
jgi:hypothetical protein